MNSATQILALKVWKLGFIKISLFSFMEPGHYCLAALWYVGSFSMKSNHHLLKVTKVNTVVIINSVSLTALNLESLEPSKVIEKFNHMCS